MKNLKTKKEIAIMRKAGRVVARTLDMIGDYIKPGVTTKQLDTLVEEFILSCEAVPAFKDYHGFPASACISIDEEVVHGIPGDRVLKAGEIVSIDIGAIVDGFYGDAARTYAVGEVSESKKALMEYTKECLKAGIDKARAGNKIGAISAAVQDTAESNGYGVVRSLVGHGIGRSMHEEPQVPNFGAPDDGPELQAGMVLAIEPMINAGGFDVKTMPDGWTVVTSDGQPSAHFEHTVVITSGDPEILTLS